MTTAENLNRIIQAKKDIKKSIENKGVDVGNVTIDKYAKKIDEIKTQWVMPDGIKFSKSSCDKFDGTEIDISNITDFSYLFYDSTIKEVDLSGWESNIIYSTNFYRMFANCKNLTTVKGIENWGFNVGTDISYMFENCISLTTLDDIKNWDVSAVNEMEYLFSGCENLTTAVLNWDFIQSQSIAQLFRNCKNLTTVDISSWQSSNVQNMGAMFYGCDKLTSISTIRCDFVYKNSYPLYRMSGNYNALTNVGGFINMKSNWTDTYGLPKCPNLTYESCINILNGLYDFTGNGETPNSEEGRLMVHKNFITLVGDDIAIGTNKGWTIYALG